MVDFRHAILAFLMDSWIPGSNQVARTEVAQMNTAMSLIGKGPLWSCIVVGFFQPNAAAKTCEHLVDDSLHSESSEVPMFLVVGTTCKHISEVK